MNDNSHEPSHDEKLRSYSFREFYDYLYSTGKLPRDEFDIDFIEESKIFKALMSNRKENTIFIESSPNSRKGFFYDAWNKQQGSQS